MIKAFPWKNRDRAAADQITGSEPPDAVGRVYGAQLNRVETKINNLLAAVAAAAAAESPPPPASAPARETSPRRVSLGTAIAEVSRRQQELDHARPASSPSRATSLISLQNDIASLGAKLDAMQREQAARYVAYPSCNLDQLRNEIATMSAALSDVASRGSVATVESAIRGLSQKIEDSRNDGMKDAVLRPMEELVAELRQSLAEIDPRMTIRGLEGELKKLGTKIEDLGRAGVDPAAFGHIQAQTREIRDLLSAAIARPLPIERIERQVADLAQSLSQQPSRPVYDDYGTGSRTDSSNFAAIEARLEHIAARVEESLNAARDQSRYRDLSDRIDSVHQGLSARIAEVQSTPPDTSALEDLVRSLSDKIERATAPQADQRAIEALEQQIAGLAQRLEQSSPNVSISSLERAISELFGEFERTRAASLEVAEETARSAVREALAGSPAHSPEQQRLSSEIDDLRARQDQADQRALSTLNAVHETLEKIVDRMSSVEAEISERGRGGASESLASGRAPVFTPPRDTPPPSPPPPPFAARPESSERPAGGAEDYLIEPGRGFPGRRDPGDTGQGPTSQFDSLEAPASRSDFIAAARRAAQAAQRETAAAAIIPARAAGAAGSEANAGLLNATRGLIAQYRRPVVLSLAAIFVAVGAYAILKGLGHPPAKLSSIEPPAAVASVSPQTMASLTAPHMPVTSMTSAAKVDDSALSPNSITAPTPAPPVASPPTSKVDPLVTGSIPHRPQAQASRREISFADLRSQARAGDAQAQFDLAMEYTDGRFVARDFRAAAEWYQKAAAQGLAPAQYRLASFYEKGLGVDRDVAKAQMLYQKAAQQGNIRAMHNLAVLAADGGDSGRPDYATAAFWFKRAAEFGVRDSQYNYAVLLARGMGVAQDFVASYVWFAVAAEQGDQDSASKRDDVGARLSPDQLAAAKATVAAFRPRSAPAAANDMTPPIIVTVTRPASEPPLSFGQRPKVSML
jgi:localization factor PodJL